MHDVLGWDLKIRGMGFEQIKLSFLFGHDAQSPSFPLYLNRLPRRKDLIEYSIQISPQPRRRKMFNHLDCPG